MIKFTEGETEITFTCPAEVHCNKLLCCDKCNQPLSKPGALLFSPPKSAFLSNEGEPRYFASNISLKYHLCCACYEKLIMEYF